MILIKSVPKQVNILPPSFEIYSISLKLAILQLLKKGKGRLLLGKILAPTAAMTSKKMGTGKSCRLLTLFISNRKNVRVSQLVI